MSPEPMVVALADRPRSLNVVGEQVTVLASGEQTGSFAHGLDVAVPPLGEVAG